ncbi:MAG: hypothetical protein JSW39_24585, partial [Desulfobacterales bacterium]
GGTNHTFFASPDICANCHGFSADAIQGPVAASLETLRDGIEAALLALIAQQIGAGNTIDLDGEATIADVADIAEIVFGESRGRQAMTVTFTDGTTVGPVSMNNVNVVADGGAVMGGMVVAAAGTVLGNLYDFADERLPKAGWNWDLIESDTSRGVHNFLFVNNVLNASIAAVAPLAGP